MTAEVLACAAARGPQLDPDAEQDADSCWTHFAAAGAMIHDIMAASPATTPTPPVAPSLFGTPAHPCVRPAKDDGGHGEELVVDHAREDGEDGHEQDAVAAAKAHAKDLVQLLLQELLLVDQQEQGEGQHDQAMAQVTCGGWGVGMCVWRGGEKGLSWWTCGAGMVRDELAGGVRYALGYGNMDAGVWR